MSLFPIEELSIIGLPPWSRQLPKILRLIRQTADAVIAAAPDMLVIIDSPDFTHRVARRVRAQAPEIPIVDYVSPSVWAWRPGRARAMRAYVDHVLALLPFEPEAYRRLDGPPCSYVGHPLTEQLGRCGPSRTSSKRRDGEPPVLLVLPGSRRSEIRHHMAVFGVALDGCRPKASRSKLVLPTMPHLQEAIAAGAEDLAVQPHIVVGESEKRAAFRIARAALAKSGTVTLELALAGVPMVTAYRRRRDRSLHPAPRDPGPLGDPGQSRGRRGCRSGILAGGLPPENARAGAARCAQRHAAAGKQIEAFARSTHHVHRQQSPSVRAAESCWRRCGKRASRARA